MGEKNIILGSILGRRLFAVFCISCLVPLILMAFVAFTQVKQELEEQARCNLQETTKAIGMTIYERMLLLSEELRRVGNALQSGPPTREELWWEIALLVRPGDPLARVYMVMPIAGGRRKAVVKARRTLSWLAVRELGYSGAEVARYLGVTTSCITRFISEGKKEDIENIDLES